MRRGVARVQRLVKSLCWVVLYLLVFVGPCRYVVSRVSEPRALSRRFQELPYVFFTIGRRCGEDCYWPVAVYASSRSIIEDTALLGGRTRAAEELRSSWPKAEIVWEEADQEAYDFLIPKARVTEVEAAINALYRASFPDDRALRKWGFEICILEEDVTAGSQLIRLEIHRGTFPDVYVYEAHQGKVVPKGYIQLTFLVGYLGLLAGTVCVSALHGLALLVRGIRARKTRHAN